MVTLTGYELEDCLLGGARATMWRAKRHEDGSKVLIKMHTRQQPTLRDAAMFKHERDMLTRLRALPVLPLVSMELHEGRSALVFDDPGGQLLSQRLQEREQPLALLEALTLTRRIAAALEQIHSGGVVHKKISPQAIFICDDGAIHLHEFGAAASAKEDSWDQPAIVAETLPYISPEQTGRVNRSVDFRSDYYALGVLLFEMCTNTLPFEAQDAMGWVHCHIAKVAPLAHERNPQVPAIISKLIARLMAKSPEQRYQSCRGLIADLDRCISAIEHAQSLDEISLGRLDLSGRFELSGKLFGRDEALAQLKAAVEQVMQTGVAGWINLSGAAGVGKSALIAELQRAMMGQGPFFIQGKFEQYQRNVPYASMIQAFRSLLQRLLMESDDELARWRAKLTETLGANVSVILDVLPELELIVGAQPAPASLGVAESQNRFELTFQRFIGLFCLPTQPLVLILDDVQWADPASLGLLQALLTNPQSRSLAIICSYRDAEIGRQHVWEHLWEAANGAKHLHIEQLTLSNLGIEELGAFVAKTLGEPVERVAPLAQILRSKTEGNPFFLRELFTSLWEQGHIYFSPELERWEWDLDAIQRAQITDNVVALLSDKIQRLDPEAQRVLKIAACVGGHFDLDTLARICALPEQRCADLLWLAMQEGLLAPLDDHYKSLLIDSFGPEDEDDSTLPKIVYRFQHDRVQQAAYSMLTNEDAAKLHLAIGRRMIEASSTFDRHERLFDVVSQLNQAITLMTDPSERLGLAQLNLSSARRAKTSLAYDFARQCALDGLLCLEHLGQEAWSQHYALMFELNLICAQGDYLLGNFEDAERRFKQLRERCTTPLDRVRIMVDQVELLGHRNKHHEAVALGLQALSELGISLPPQPKTPSILKEVAAVRWARRTVLPADLKRQPEVKDERIRLAKTMILTMAASANFTSTTLFPLLVLKMTQMAIKYGHTDGSSFAYAGYGLILTAVLNDIATGRAFGELSLELSDQYEAKNQSAKVRNLFLFGGIINHWSAPARTNVPYLERCIAAGLECGDFVYTGYAITLLIDSLFYAGEHLPTLLERSTQGLELLERVRDDDSTRMAQSSHQSVLALMGQTHGLTSLDDNRYDEAACYALMLASSNQNPTATYYTNKLRLLILAGQYDEALTLAQKSNNYPEGTLGLLLVPEHMYYHAIAIAKCYEHATAKDRLSMTRQLNVILGKLRKMAKHSPDNFAHKVKLLEALWAINKQDELEIGQRFDEAISLAQRSRASHDEGLANVLAAEHYIANQRYAIAQAYAQQGYQAYERWGATALLRDLERRFPELMRQRLLTPDHELNAVSSPILAPQEAESGLDLATVLKATQALSSEIQLEPLLERLLKIVIENAGAQRGLVLLYHEGALRVFASIGAEQDHAHTFLKQPHVPSPQAIATKIVNYVERTQDSVVLEDASKLGSFTADSYVVTNKPKSLLCMPVLHKGAMIGALYLENNLTTGAFTQDRLEVLSVVCTQLAISIENARMYQEVERARQDLEGRVIERTQELEHANHELQFEIAERKRAQAQAQEASQSKSLFLANMSHELRTPLNAIIGYSELMREDMEDMGNGEHIEDVGRILVSAHHLLNLINDILDLSKIEAQKMDVILSDIDLEVLLSEVATTAKPLVEKNNNGFSMLTESLVMRSDKTKLTQVLVNLISNASKFTEQGMIRLELKSHQLDGQPWVHVSVTDTGIGMSEAQIGRLFQAFSQAESDTHTKYGGTGLGLALSRQLCRLLGGDIHVESAPGKGSTFTVVLPQFPDEESLADEASVTFS